MCCQCIECAGVWAAARMTFGVRAARREASAPVRPANPRATTTVAAVITIRTSLQITGVEEMLSQWHQGVVKIHRVELKGSRSSIDGGAMVLQITPAERAVLQLLADGNPTVDIANRLGLSERAMDTMLTTLLESMGAASHVEAVEDAQRRGLLSALGTEVLPATR